MTIYLLMYDLKQPGQRHQAMAHCLGGMDSHHLQLSVWLVRSYLSAEDLREHVKALTDWNDKLDVFAVGADFATGDPLARFWLQGLPTGLLAAAEPTGLAALSKNPLSPADAILKALIDK